MATCSIQDLIDAGNCFLAIPDPFREAVQTVLLCRLLQAIDPMASCDLQTLLDDGKCFLAIGEQERDAIQTQLLCEILQAGGLGGQSCISCGIVDPVADPNCNCAYYYRTDTGAEWIWDDGAGLWRQMLGGP